MSSGWISPGRRTNLGLIVYQREIQKDGVVRLHSASCEFLYRRLCPGVLVVTITGDDKGEFGMAPLHELDAEIARGAPLALFVDTRAARGAATSVTEDWTAWFAGNQKNLRSVAILATSKFVQLIVSIAKHLSRTGEMIRIYTEGARFEQAIAREAPGFTGASI
jgi:hypothetical protein